MIYTYQPALVLRLLTSRASGAGMELDFFFIATATPEIYTLSLHDALPICYAYGRRLKRVWEKNLAVRSSYNTDRKSTRLNSSHRCSSYAVFCLKKKSRARSKKFNGSTATRRSARA